MGSLYQRGEVWFNGERHCPDCGKTKLKKGASNATINREMAALRRILNLGARQTPPKVNRVPYIPMLKENNTRKGFFEHGEFLALKNAIPDHLRGFVTFGYKTGWRISEIANLTWDRIDLTQGIVRFDKAWKTACQKAGIGIRIFHDFRRTAVRNMVRSGIPERVAMMISGHKTRAVFDRYNIVDDRDLKRTAAQQEKYFESGLGTILGTIVPFQPKNKPGKASNYL